MNGTIWNKILLIVACAFLLFPKSVVNAKVEHLANNYFENLTGAASRKPTGRWLVKFNEPNCAECDRLIPILDELSTELETDHSDERIFIGQVDCMTYGWQVCERFSIFASFPTLKYIAEGKVYSYQGSRTKDDLLNFVLKDYTTKESENVPQVKVIYNQKIKNIKVAAVVLVFVGLIFGLLVMASRIIFGGEPEKKED